MINYFSSYKKRENRRRGFSLMELLVVIAIIAALCGLIFVATGRIAKSLRFKQCNDYAETIFMAAQSNLTAMRNNGQLAALEGKGLVLPENTGFPVGEGTDQYVYTSSASGFADYEQVLPLNSVETHIRGKQVIIEYNPVTGNVFAVFYCENDTAMLSLYRSGKLPRDDESARRKLEVGYHQGSILSKSEIEMPVFEASMEYKNEQEGYVLLSINADVPASSYKSNLDVKLTITGKTSKKTRIVPLLTGAGGKREKTKTSGNTVTITYMLDSLADGLSFANFSANNESGLGEISAESKFTFLPGEEVTVEADVSFKGNALADEVWTSGKSVVANPMFHSLSSNVLTVANGRNLQNLNALTPSIATTVKEVRFGADIDWNETVAYYNNTYAGGATYQNSNSQAPGRALPYFVPIQNAPLMGTVKVNGLDVTFHSLSRNPVINGNSKKIINLNIDSTRYRAPSGGEYYVSATTSQVVHYSSTGLFAFVNSEIKNLTMVNCIIKGLDFASSAGTCATGSMAGVAGYKAFFKNCAVYMERNTLEDYNATSGPKEYKADGVMNWYGVSGEGCVGGLVGYSKSQRLATGYIYSLEHKVPVNASDYLVKTVQESEVTFYKCFSAVPVSGNMQGNGDKNYGYVNGVGGLVGLTRISNFYGCYASGDVMATGVYTTVNNSTNWSILNLQGKKSMGAGGLVGTSQGSMYWNCFTTGDVQSNQASGTGSFLGVMVYNGRFTASSEDYKHLTLMEDCYTTGKINGSNTSAFVGGNASIDLTNQISSTHKIYTDFYQMIAPYYCEFRNVADIDNRDLQGKIYAPTSPEAYTNKSGDVIYYYIAKDCYYLDLSRTKEQVDFDRTHIGAAMSYGILRDVDISLAPGSWVTKQWDNILTWTTEDGKTFYEAYYHHKVHSAVYEDFTALKNFYDMQLRSAFDNPWQGPNSYEGETHSFINPGATYGFAMVDGLNYHGEWPTQPLVLDDGACGLAYWEWYADANGEFDEIHAQFDREDTGDLLTNEELREQGAWLVADGYAVVVPSTSATVKIKVGTAGAVTLSKTYARPWTYNGQTVYLYPLTRAVLNNSATRLTSAEDFYVQATITVGSTNYTAFYNPYAANSQVNPYMGKKGWQNPERGNLTTPAQIEIRSARQLAGLMQTQTKKYLAEGYSYIQTIDIDASKWTGGSTANTKIVYSSTDKTNLKNPITTSNGIGNAVTQEFGGTYTGVGTGDARPVIANFFGRKYLGLFLHIGDTGVVSNLVLKQDSATTWDYSAKTNAGAGMLADVSDGTIRNVDVVISAAVTLKAKNNAGLLVGKSSGTIENCNVNATAVTLNCTATATSAGGVVGDLTGSVTGGSVNITTSMLVTAKNVGGFAGLATNATVEGVTTNVKALSPATGTYVGGMVGYITGGKITNVNVTVSGTSQVHGGLTSLADNGALIKDVNVTVEGTMTAANASGLAATVDAASVADSTVTVKGTINGTTNAAGLAATYTMSAGSACDGVTVVVEDGGQIKAGTSSAGFVATMTVAKEDAFKDCQVTLNGGTISGTKAAGFVGQISGTAQNCAVVGSGSIAGSTSAAGFAVTLNSGTIVKNSRVTPALEQSAEAYLSKNNSNLTVNGATSAGFAVTVSSGCTVSGCDVLCTVSGNSPSGFADTNNAIIETSTAQVTITKGSAFVRNNTNKINNCYGWYGDGSTNTTAVAVPGSTVGRYYSCYFADVDVPSDQANNLQCVTLYNSAGTLSKMTLNELTTAYSKLATTNNNQWSIPGKFEAYSYNAAVVKYSYPMLRVHCGNWAIPSTNIEWLANYAGDDSYGVVNLDGNATEAELLLLCNYSGNAPAENIFSAGATEVTDGWRKECVIL